MTDKQLHDAVVMLLPWTPTREDIKAVAGKVLAIFADSEAQKTRVLQGLFDVYEL